MRFYCAGATLSHDMRVDRQKLRKNCDFTCAGATLSHEMMVDRQKLRIMIYVVTFTICVTGWWFQRLLIFHFIYGMSSETH